MFLTNLTAVPEHQKHGGVRRLTNPTLVATQQKQQRCSCFLQILQLFPRIRRTSIFALLTKPTVVPTQQKKILRFSYFLQTLQAFQCDRKNTIFLHLAKPSCSHVANASYNPYNSSHATQQKHEGFLCLLQTLQLLSRSRKIIIALLLTNRVVVPMQQKLITFVHLTNTTVVPHAAEK